MADLNVYHDVTGRTLTVWFGAPQDEYVCEETGDEVVLMKDKSVRRFVRQGRAGEVLMICRLYMRQSGGVGGQGVG